ncbi:hypothetical protein NC653_000182 [Populus alba x Populus x berolinensis]|uniref:Uncharacterized protein n=1 Tax=Populus alba x Populus x berolinensis TaxID=444605 RepID=A0AAD6RIG7_9ROSI|nr:hypothetical protein NC653_000182 [Populus alba x Populus x berolinensis]
MECCYSVTGLLQKNAFRLRLRLRLLSLALLMETEDEKKEEENQSLSMGRNTQASLMGGSWRWQNVKAFVNGGSAALLTQLQFLLVESAIYYYLRS